MRFRQFKDFDVTFKKHPVNNDLMIVKDDKSIIQSMISILSTKVGERIVDKEFGTNLQDFLFEPANDSTASDLREEITRAITENEPRVRNLEVEVQSNPRKRGYQIYIHYYTKEPDLADPEPREVLDFFLPSK